MRKQWIPGPSFSGGSGRGTRLESIVVEGECKPCSAKLEKGCKTVDDIVVYPRQDDSCRPTDCKRPLFLLRLVPVR